MTALHLRACPACSRHVRVSELACPFCGGALDDAFRATALPVPLTVRLSRAAILALGTGSLSFAAACGGATTGLLPQSEDAGVVDRGSSGSPDAGDEAPDASNEGYDGASLALPYGVPPPPFDAGTEPPPDDASVPDDARVIIAPPYGGPP